MPSRSKPKALPKLYQRPTSSSTNPNHQTPNDPPRSSLQEEKEKENEKEENSPNSIIIPCEFTTPCLTNPPNHPTHPRKVISHIFGRNKTATKLFPAHVWIHYCRKHYQRARYRSSQWPFTQCELLGDSLARMQAWGGVDWFEVCLRRREVMRVFGSAATSMKGREDADDADDDDDEEKKRRKKPLIVPAPVPGWLRLEIAGGEPKSFDQVRELVRLIRQDMERVRDAGGQVRFPDIEILPVFKGWVTSLSSPASSGSGSGARSGNSRVSKKGAIQKLKP